MVHEFQYARDVTSLAKFNVWLSISMMTYELELLGIITPAEDNFHQIN